jgi:TonB family protein
VTPPTAKWLGVKGEVTLRVIVKADGSVAASPRVLVARPAGRGFEEAAVEAVRQWRYTPATRRGQPVESELTIRVDFE